jgi:hypothetical protein
MTISRSRNSRKDLNSKSKVNSFIAKDKKRKKMKKPLALENEVEKATVKHIKNFLFSLSSDVT